MKISGRPARLRIVCAILFLSLYSSCRTTAPPFDPQKYECPSSCKPPGCFCPSVHPPGGLSPAETPQFVTLSFDDAVTGETFDLLAPLLAKKNPNGCPVRATFFVTTDDTDYWLVQRLYAEGHEIAVHTMTHKTNLQTSKKEWTDEIRGTRKALSEFAGIPKEKMAGFRAPYLKYNEQSFQEISGEHFSYDASVTEMGRGLSQGGQQMIWPYTLDYGIAQACYTGVCPQKRYPGLFEFPLYAMLREDGDPIAMDPEGSDDSVFELWKKNFEQHYRGNRSPFGIFLHAKWVAEGNHRETLERFLDWALAQENVWLVTMQDVIDYMRRPVPADQISNVLKCPVPK